MSEAPTEDEAASAPESGSTPSRRRRGSIIDAILDVAVETRDLGEFAVLPGTEEVFSGAVKGAEELSPSEFSAGNSSQPSLQLGSTPSVQPVGPLQTEERVYPVAVQPPISPPTIDPYARFTKNERTGFTALMMSVSFLMPLTSTLFIPLINQIAGMLSRYLCRLMAGDGM